MSSKKKSNNFIMQGSILAIASVIVRIIGLLYRVPLADIIGNIGNNYYGSAYEIYSMVLLISSYSIPLAVSKEMSTKIALKQYKNAQRIFLASLGYAVVVGAVAALATFIAAPVLGPETGLVLRVLSPTIFFSAILGVFRGYFQGHNTMMPTSISQIIEQILNAVGSVLIAYILTEPFFAAGEDAKAYAVGAAGSAAGTGIGVVAGLLFVLAVYFMYRPVAKRRAAMDRSGVVDSYKDIYRIIFMTITPVIFSTFIYNISGTVDLLLYKKITLIREMPILVRDTFWGIFMGHYKVLVNVPIALASAIAAAMIPSITAAIARNDGADTNRKVDMAIQFTMMISIPAAIGMSVLAEPILKLLFTSTYTITSVKLLTMGGFVIIFYALSTVSNGVLQGIGQLKLPVRHSAISLILHIIVLVPMLYFFDLHVYAVLFATLVFTVSMCVLNAISIKQYLDYEPDYKKTFLIPLACSIAMGILTKLIYMAVYFLVPSNVIAITIAIIAACLTYFSLMILLKGITAEELNNFPKGHLLLRIAIKLKLIR